MQITPGLYELVINQLLDRRLSELDAGLRAETEALDVGESHAVLAQYLERVTRSALASVDGPARLEQQVQVCNRVLQVLEEALPSLGSHDAALSGSARRLLSVCDTSQQPLNRPETPLSIGALLTGTRLDPSLISQLKKEIRAAERIDILCSFIKWSGIRILENELQEFTARPSARLRVITTSYMGATDLKAVDFLQGLPNTELKVSYDTHRTRLHAKAYMFHRGTGFGAAYVGSSNLSHAAMTEGLEWNVKVSQYESAHLWHKINATFETYWNDAEFETYSPQDQARLRHALQSERAGEAADAPVFFDLRPYGFQQEILDRLEAERQLQDRNRHLVVAATGTGKTMIAAFDYRAWSQSQKVPDARPRLLFVAHREEILKQSLATFRAVLKDQNFGELLGAGQKPAEWQHVFASIQSYNSQEVWAMSRDAFDYVVVDEFHHASAPSYERLMNHVQPQVLVGLTATPERADGRDITKYFDGHISAEIRLPDAINRKLLSPFQYFGVTDSEDLSALTWQRGGYSVQELDKVFTGNELRASLVRQKVHEKVADVRDVRGLGFCVSVAHAEFMADHFNRHGIPAQVLTGDSSSEIRNSVQGQLRRRDINFIFVVDLYNEGVDIPEVDTVLFLRPTESLTVFLQQLGRGLRLHDDKDTLTVLDFIGQSHRNFRFDWRFRSLLSDASLPLLEQVQQGFPHLPAGCSIELERVARQHVMANIRQAVQQNRPALAREVAALADALGRPPALSEFLERYELDTNDIYRRGVSWSRLCVEARVLPGLSEPDEDVLTRGLRRLQHIDSPQQIRTLLPLLSGELAGDVDAQGSLVKRRVLMLMFSLWGREQLPASLRAGLQRLQTNPQLCLELMQVLKWKLSRISEVAPVAEVPFECPLELHASYTRDEVLAGLGHWTLQQQREMREGVLHLAQLKADAFFVTLNKTERDYSPTTMYEDYAVSESLFHWQSQSTTSEQSATGRRYIEHAERSHTIMLFAREHKTAAGQSCPYFFLGPAAYQSHTGSRPLNILWHLRHPLSAKLLRGMARLAIS